MSQTHSVNAATTVRVIVRCALFGRPENVDLRITTPENVRRVRCQSAEADKKRACAMIVVMRNATLHTAETHRTHTTAETTANSIIQIHTAMYVNPRSQTVQQRVKSHAVHRWNNDIEINLHKDERWHTHNWRRPRLYVHFTIYNTTNIHDTRYYARSTKMFYDRQWKARHKITKQHQ